MEYLEKMEQLLEYMTFAIRFFVHALEKMVDEGNDIYCSLPILSTYLGHRGLESTEKYLRLTIEAHASIIDTMTEYYNNAYPEVVDYEN
ncbi:site-specific integrase [Serpentinicella alkaliphila]|uniref:hypothetical protein n=1 Tax=Serpentinicella alkaliphila TaxID=1734049 RepID=UPI001BC85993|nr:hypothetical protein [Serpentinicella alkaliphila]